LVQIHRDLLQIKGQKPQAYKTLLKNPIRLLRTAIGGPHLPKTGQVPPLMAAGGLCAAAVLVLAWADGSSGRDTAKQTPAEISSEQTTSGDRSIRPERAADPAGALAHAFTLGDRSERDNLVRDLLSSWAARDAEEALEWVSALEDSAARRSARSTVCLAVAEKDPHRAVVLALAHGTDQDDDGGLLESLTMQWCEKESETVLKWVCEQPPGEWRDRLLGRASFVLSKSDPAAAAQLVSGLEPGNLQDEAAMAVLHQWALQDSAAALRWAEAFSESTLRERALAEISNLRTQPTSLQEVR
jgi:hypothetical protein